MGCLSGSVGDLTFHKPVWYVSVLKFTERTVCVFHRQLLLQDRVRVTYDSDNTDESTANRPVCQ